MERIIFHIDVNSAYLSWSALKLLQEHPESTDIRTIPAIIGGNRETRQKNLPYPDGRACSKRPEKVSFADYCPAGSSALFPIQQKICGVSPFSHSRNRTGEY